MNDGLPDDYAERVAFVNEFIGCRECGSDRATIEVRNPDPWDATVSTRIRAVCPECEEETEWVPL